VEDESNTQLQLRMRRDANECPVWGISRQHNMQQLQIWQLFVKSGRW